MTDELYLSRLRVIQADLEHAEAIVMRDGANRLARKEPLERRRLLAWALFELYRKGDGPGTGSPELEPVRS